MYEYKILMSVFFLLIIAFQLKNYLDKRKQEFIKIDALENGFSVGEVVPVRSLTSKKKEWFAFYILILIVIFHICKWIMYLKKN